MRKFLITSAVYTGEVEMVFDENGRLSKIDFSNTNMSVLQIASFKSKAFAHIDNLETAFNKGSVVIVEADYQVSFEDFWNKYDQKHNKKRCELIWDKLSKVDKVKAFHGLNAYLKHLRKNDWKSKADPDTYLRQRYWESDWK